MASRALVLSTYRSLMREGRRFNDYNFREYIIRRVRESFRDAKGVKDTEAVANLLQKARSELDVVKRSRTVDNLYSKGQSVLDKM